MPLMTADDFAGFYTAHFGRIATQLHAYLGDRHEAQDLTQEAFCRAYDRWGRISAYERPESWVRQVAWNLATNRLRHLRVAMRYLARQREEQVDGPSLDRVVLVRELAKLPANQRLAIVLHHIGELSTSEIAEQQGVAEGTVRSWLSRGRAALAEQLIEAPALWETTPAIDKTLSLVRRRRALRRATLAAILAVLVALPIAILLRGQGSEPPFIGPSHPAKSPSSVAIPVANCTARNMPGIPDGAAPLLVGGEPKGRYFVGMSLTPGGSYRPVLWTDGLTDTFEVPEGSLTGIAVNSLGVVVISANVDNGSAFKLWTYHEGRLEAVLENIEPAKVRQVLRVNARGDILLSGSDAYPPAVRLAGPNPVLRELPVPAGATRVTAKDLDDDGSVVGYTDDEVSPIVWAPDLAVRRLQIVTQGATASASRIRGEWVLGIERPGTTPLRWNLRTGVFMRMPDLDSATAITSAGWVLGTAAGRPVVRIAGNLVQLPARPEFSGPVIAFISDDGRVIGGNNNVMRNTDQVAIGWTCSWT